MSLPHRLDIQDLPASARFLTIAARRSASGWKQECAAVGNWLATKPAALSQQDLDAMRRILDVPLPPDAHPVAVLHCYADVPAGTRYDIVFDRHDLDTSASTSAEVLFGVAFDQYVEPTLSHGHHQTAVLRFPNGMPSLLERLPWDAISSDYLCLCAAADFAEIRRSLTGTHRERIDTFLVDPARPCWSSYTLQQMFAGLEGDPRQRVLAILPQIDERLATASRPLTEEQTHFLRAVALHVYPAHRLAAADLAWLVARFRVDATPQRALILALLVSLDELPGDLKSKILWLLRDTPGDRYVAGDRPDQGLAT